MIITHAEIVFIIFGFALIHTINLFANISKDYNVIAESGIKSRSDIEMYNDLGIFNFLIGESILKSNNYEIFIKKLLNNG